MPAHALPAEQAAPPPAAVGRWDRIGIFVSGACLVHCLLLPVVVALLPLFSFSEALHTWMHPVAAAVLIPTTLLALRSARRLHGDRAVQLLLWAGLALVVPAAILGHVFTGALSETLVTLAGSLLLIGGHWRNWRRRACARRPAPPQSARPLATR